MFFTCQKIISPCPRCFQMTFSKVGNILGFCNLLVVQPRHTQKLSKRKLISISLCILLAITAGCLCGGGFFVSFWWGFFGNYNILWLPTFASFCVSFSRIFMQMLKFLSNLLEVFSCTSSYFPSCNTPNCAALLHKSMHYVLPHHCCYVGGTC